MKRCLFALQGTFLACLLAFSVTAAEDAPRQTLPNYYQFFMKTGNQKVIPEEHKRDEQIKSGLLKPIHVGRPAPDFRLPDGFGHVIGLRDYVGEKNVVLVTMRTWW